MSNAQAIETMIRPPLLETETPVKPTKSPSKPKEGDDLDERVKRIIREIPGPTPQPGGE